VLFSLEKFLLARIICQKTGGICWHSNLTPSRPGKTNRSDRCLRVVSTPVAGLARHACQTGVSNQSDRCPSVRNKSRSPDRIRLVKGIPCGTSPPHPNKYEGSRPVDYDPIDHTYLPLFVSYLFLSLTLAFPISSVVLPLSPRCLKVF
jgi:hypothetical protein